MRKSYIKQEKIPHQEYKRKSYIKNTTPKIPLDIMNFEFSENKSDVWASKYVGWCDKWECKKKIYIWYILYYENSVIPKIFSWLQLD